MDYELRMVDTATLYLAHRKRQSFFCHLASEQARRSKTGCGNGLKAKNG